MGRVKHSPSVLLTLQSTCSLPPRPARKQTLHLPGRWGERHKQRGGGLFWSSPARLEKNRLLLRLNFRETAYIYKPHSPSSIRNESDILACIDLLPWP